MAEVAQPAAVGLGLEPVPQDSAPSLAAGGLLTELTYISLCHQPL